MNTRLKKLFFFIIPLFGIVSLAPSAFAKHHHHKHCNPYYGNSYYGDSYYGRQYYDRPYYGRRYNDQYYGYDNDDYYRRRTPRYQQPYDNGYYGGSYYPPAGNLPWWDILIPRY